MNRHAVLLAWLVLVSAPVACRDRKTAMDGREPTASLNDLAHELKLTFPPTTRLIGVLRDQGMDDRARVKVEMNAADVPAFLGATPIESTSFRPGPRGRLGEDSGFWNPNHASKLRTAFVIRDHRALNSASTRNGPTSPLSTSWTTVCSRIRFHRTGAR